MCQWHPSQTPWERKWEAKRENNWKMRYCAGRAAVAEGRLPFPPLQPCSAHVFSFYPWLFITTQGSVDVSVTSQLLKSALCWCPFLPVPPRCLLCYEFQMLLFNVALEEKGGKERV